MALCCQGIFVSPPGLGGCPAATPDSSMWTPSAVKCQLSCVTVVGVCPTSTRYGSMCTDSTSTALDYMRSVSSADVTWSSGASPLPTHSLLLMALCLWLAF